MISRAIPVLPPDLTVELDLWRNGIHWVVGIDEAGRGALAGPVAVGAVCLPPDPQIADQLCGVRDSKQLEPAERLEWAEQIKVHALGWAVGFASNDEIDRIGIAPATRLAAQRALSALACTPEYLLIDYFRLTESDLPQLSLVKGDQRCLTIAAASIIAKTERDRWMLQIDALYPEYGFAIHKGYATALHLERILRRGACPLHRRTFAPLRNLASQKA